MKDFNRTDDDDISIESVETIVAFTDEQYQEKLEEAVQKSNLKLIREMKTITGVLIFG